MQVHENECPLQHGHGHEVGGTGRSCSSEAPDWLHVYHSASNESIGHGSSQYCGCLDEAADCKKQFIETGVIEGDG